MLVYYAAICNGTLPSVYSCIQPLLETSHVMYGMSPECWCIMLRSVMAHHRVHTASWFPVVVHITWNKKKYIIQWILLVILYTFDNARYKNQNQLKFICSNYSHRRSGSQRVNISCTTPHDGAVASNEYLTSHCHGDRSNSGTRYSNGLWWS
jgi:hypothetical protein